MQQPAQQQTELDKSQDEVPLNQPNMAMPATGQPVMAAPATSQPTMYQMPPGQPQPMFVQAAPGQPAMSPQGQPGMAAPHPGQPYVAAATTSQPIMQQTLPGQPQPMFVQAPPGQPAMSPQGQPLQHYIGGQPVQQGQQVQLVQPVQGQWVHGHPQPSQDLGMAAIQINKAYMKSGLGISRSGEFFILLVAWICITIYSNRMFNTDKKANFFKGTTIFCWVMVIIFQIIYMFGINKSMRCFGRPSNFTIIAIAFQVLLTILLISCTGSLTVRATQFSNLFTTYTPYGSNAYLIYTSTAFGYLAFLDFLFDIYCLVVMYQQERAQEVGRGIIQPAQQPGIILQQQVGMVAQPPVLPQVTQ